MSEKIFSSARETPFAGWRQIQLDGWQLHRQFRDTEGNFRYGLYPLRGESLREIEEELVEPDPQSMLNIAVVDAGGEGWTPVRLPAFRHDLDFYVFTRCTPAALKALEELLKPLDPAPALCLHTRVDAL